MSEKTFAITFDEAKCGLEILYIELSNEFIVGDNYHSNTAKMFGRVLQGARILSLNGTQFTGMTSVNEVKTLFQTAGSGSKLVVFKSKLSKEQLNALEKFDNESKLFRVIDDKKVDICPGQYIVEMHRRPLGFMIAPSPGGHIEVVQVDSVHEDDLKMGSKLMSVNGEKVVGVKNAIHLLKNSPAPLQLVLQRAPEESLFAPEEKKDGNVLALSCNTGDLVELSVHWFDQNIGKKDFILLTRADATLAEIRAKIAVTNQLKFSAVKLVAKGALLKDDAQRLLDLKFQASDNVTVVVSETEQMKEEKMVEVDYAVQMRIMGAFLKSCDKTLLDYLWDDIDYQNEGVLHITELDRILARIMGIYERAACVYSPLLFRNGIVEFNTKESLGLVIEGNEVIMCNPQSQAKREGMVAGWRIVGAEYIDKDGRMVKFAVDHRTCLHSLKRAKAECTNAFRILCLIPHGEKWEAMTIMKKHAIAVLKLDDPAVQNTILRENYEQFPDIFSQNAIRISFLDTLKASAFWKLPCSENGALISKEVENPELKGYVGSTVLSVNGQTVVHMPFGKIMELLFDKRKYYTVTIDKLVDVPRVE